MDQLQVFINKTLRVTTTDARLFVGELKCTDRDRNLILAAASEFRAQESLKGRFIGAIVIPGTVITKIEVDETPVRRVCWPFNPEAMASG